MDENRKEGQKISMTNSLLILFLYQVFSAIVSANCVHDFDRFEHQSKFKTTSSRSRCAKVFTNRRARAMLELGQLEGFG